MRHAVILAGGQGTRLWPWSTAQRPKQIVPLVHGRSLLSVALERATAVAGDQVWVVAGADLVDVAGDELAPVAGERVLVEPSGRDTLAALCLAMDRIRATDPEAVTAVLTADHVITPVEEVAAAFRSGFALAESDPRTLVTFGVVPDHAATGFGWLELGGGLGDGYRVSAFREKPGLSEAATMLTAGPARYLWNSGMFVWRAEALLAAAAAFAPAHAAAAAPLDTAAWDALARLSVDHGVMEAAAQEGSGFTVAAVPLRAHWRDVGSWAAFAELVGPDADGNALAGRVAVLDSTNCVVASDDPEHLVALLGVDGLVVVRTPTATLVCRADDVQRVKQLQALVAEVAPDRA